MWKYAGNTVNRKDVVYSSHLKCDESVVSETDKSVEAGGGDSGLEIVKESDKKDSVDATIILGPLIESAGIEWTRYCVNSLTHW